MVIFVCPQFASVGVSGGGSKWAKLIPGFSRKPGTGLSFSRSSQRKGSRFVASAAMGIDGGVAEVSEGEKAPTTYSWPDKKVGFLLLNLHLAVFRHDDLRIIACSLLFDPRVCGVGENK